MKKAEDGRGNLGPQIGKPPVMVYLRRKAEFSTTPACLGDTSASSHRVRARARRINEGRVVVWTSGCEGEDGFGDIVIAGKLLRGQPERGSADILEFLHKQKLDICIIQAVEVLTHEPSA